MATYTDPVYVAITATLYYQPTSATSGTLYVTSDGLAPDISVNNTNVLFSQTVSLANLQAGVKAVVNLDSTQQHAAGL